ncbi:hypothetical protein PMIN05_012078 [Paraphaeosphaeria minitans]
MTLGLIQTLTGLLMLHNVVASPQYSTPPPLDQGQLGAVASESSICSRIGTELLKQGGNAADALVGTVACVGVIGMYHSGIGGGGFMIVRSPNGTFEFIDFRETAPDSAFEDMYKDNEDASLNGGLAAGVPGEVRGLQHLHDKYGKLPWSAVWLPAVKVAREGWTVNEDLVNYIKSAIGLTGNATSNFLVDDPAFAIDFAPHGRLPRLNETITRKRYANTLETIAYEGPDAFYSGPMAESTIRTIQARNGTMTLGDLKNYTVAIRKPSTITYRDYKLTACSAPSGGEVTLAILKILEGYDDLGDPSTVNLTTHRLDEAMKFAYGMRTELGDPSYLPGIDAYQEAMVSAATVRSARARSGTKSGTPRPRVHAHVSLRIWLTFFLLLMRPGSRDTCQNQRHSYVRHVVLRPEGPRVARDAGYFARCGGGSHGALHQPHHDHQHAVWCETCGQRNRHM